MRKVVVNGVEVWLPADSGGGPQQEVMIDKCFETFKGLPEDKYAIIETNESETIVCAAIGWLLHHLNNSTGKDKSKILYMCGSDWECLRRFADFESTIGGHHARKIMLDSRETMEKLFSKYPHEEKTCSPQVIFTWHTFFLLELLPGFPEKEIQFTLEDTLVILDDAHVLEDNCINVGSRALSHCKVDKYCQQLDTISEHNSDYVKLCALMAKFRKEFKGTKPYIGGDIIVTYNGGEIKNKFQLYMDQLVRERDLRNTFDIDVDIFDFVSHVYKFSVSPEVLNNVFKMYSVTEFKREQHSEECRGELCRTFELVCLDPSVIMERLVKLNPHSLIITGATVTPFDPLIDELGLSQVKNYEFQPIVEDFKIFARIVSCGAGGYFLNSNESVRNDSDYRLSLGKTILEIFALTPSSKGIMVFFPAYHMMQDCKMQWKNHSVSTECSLWDMFCKYRDTFTVTRDSTVSMGYDEVCCKNALERLTKSRKDSHGKGCCLMTVFHGQISKDLKLISFDDRRVVVMAGFPYPPVSDPKIRLKRDFNSSQYKEKKSNMDGAHFLRRKAYRAIRHIVDRQIDVAGNHHAIILFCDERFDARDLPKWIRKNVTNEKRFEELLFEMKDFSDSINQRVEWFNEAKAGSTQPETQFGGVRRWELEQVRLYCNKVKKGNEMLEGLKKRLTEDLLSLQTLKEELQKSLDEKLKPLLQEPESGSGDQQPADAQMVVEENENVPSSPQKAEAENMNISFSPLKISTRKRPYPPETDRK